MKYVLISLLLCLSLNANNQKPSDGILLAISMYLNINQRLDVPRELNLNDDEKIIMFTLKKLEYRKKDLGIKRFGEYIIVHYERKGKKWEVRKFGNSLVINKNTMKYFYFELSKS
jgi:hypothetical protein